VPRTAAGDWAAVANLPLGIHLRVDLFNAGHSEGRLTHVDDHELALADRKGASDGFFDRDEVIIYAAPNETAT